MGISTHKTEWEAFYTELSLNLALMCQGYGHQRRTKGDFSNIQDGQYGTEGGLRKNLGLELPAYGKFLNVLIGCYLERQNTCFRIRGTFPTPLTHCIFLSL